MYDRSLCEHKCSTILLTCRFLPFRVSFLGTILETSFLFVFLVLAMSVMLFAISSGLILPLKSFVPAWMMMRSGFH